MRTLLALLLVASTVLPCQAQTPVAPAPQFVPASPAMIELAKKATAAGPLAGARTKDWNPPAEFDKAYPYGWKVIFIANRWELFDLCRHGAACAPFPREGIGCHIYMPVTGMLVNGFRITEEDQLRMLRHEMGHCNGWGPNHPGVINPFTGKMGG